MIMVQFRSPLLEVSVSLVSFDIVAVQLIAVIVYGNLFLPGEVLARNIHLRADHPVIGAEGNLPCGYGELGDRLDVFHQITRTQHG